MSNFLPVTLIVPSNEESLKLKDLLRAVLFWTKFPSEIIISDNSKKKFIIDKKIKQIFKKKKILLRVLYKKNQYPGQARNLAIQKAAFSNLAFLDISTFCSNEWLQASYALLNKNIDVVYGSTRYLAYSYKSRLFRAATFGNRKLRTLPGSVIKKKIFKKIGLFSNTVRAGEDGLLFDKINNLKLSFKNSPSIIEYTGNLNVSFLFFFRKWVRNYYSSSSLDFMMSQKIAYFFGTLILLISIILFLMDYSDILQLIILFYIFFRGLILPFTKCEKNYLFIILNFPFILIISAWLDLAKTIGFALYYFMKLFNYFNNKISQD